MKSRNNVVAALVAASFAAMALPTYAEEIYINIDPPHRRAEQHENRAGYVWVPGVWQWNSGKHEWVAGHQVAVRKGYHYENDRWVKHENDKWIMQRGGWSLDSDRDGVPDRLDNHPNDPRRN
jgi:hypothetical protein